MRIDYQVPVEMPDGAVLRADVFRPIEDGRYPVILTHGVYAKGLPFNGPIYKMQWDKLVAKDPSVLEGSTNKHQAWEVPDPERWVPHGYALARVDSRGAGWSPGVLWPRNPLEFDDIASLGRVGGDPALEHRPGRHPRASPTTRSWDGPRRSVSPSTWPPSSPGKASPTPTATPTTTEASSASSPGDGRSVRSTRSNTARESAPRSTPTPASRSPAR